MAGKKKLELDLDFEGEYVIFALVTGLKEYTLAWHLNKLLHIKLKKAKDLEYSMKKGKYFSISNFLYSTEHLTFRLLRNRGFGSEENVTSFLVPEMNKYDFFLHIHGEIDLIDRKSIQSHLKESDFLSYVNDVETEKLKSKYNFVTLH